MELLNLENVTAGYGSNIILQNLDLHIDKGELVSLLGSSGCGKTTTLRLIAGFSEPLEGRILFDGKDYTHVPLHKRNFGVVFQSYALFPHMNIFDNVAFGLRMRKTPEPELGKRVKEALEMVDLGGFEKRYPKEMSGGQRQRVALARALVIKPDLLLMDEPLSNLDAKLRVRMRVEIRRLQQEFGITTIYVTHDQEECFAISDKVAIMNQGRIEQMDRPSVIYNHPSTEFVARFVGFENFLQWNGGRLCIRPEDVVLLGGNGCGDLDGEVSVETYLGKRYQYNVRTALGEVVVNSDSRLELSSGRAVSLRLPEDKMIRL